MVHEKRSLGPQLSWIWRRMGNLLIIYYPSKACLIILSRNGQRKWCKRRLSLGKIQGPWRILEWQTVPGSRIRALFLPHREIWHHLSRRTSEWLGTNEQVSVMCVKFYTYELLLRLPFPVPPLHFGNMFAFYFICLWIMRNECEIDIDLDLKILAFRPDAVIRLSFVEFMFFMKNACEQLWPRKQCIHWN